MANEFQIQGLEAFLRKIEGVKREIVGKAVRSAAGKAMRPVRDSARNKARAFDDPHSPANIAKNVATSTRNYPKKGEVVAKVGIRGGARPRPGNEDTGHWRFLEFGTEKMHAQPFMRPSLDENVNKVVDAVVAELEPALDKAVAKAR
jgi:HK97 gp10 family phage protein